jgi:hypothetical protein
MVIYLLCLFNDAFNGFHYTESNNKELVMMRQKRANFIGQQFLVKGQEEPRRNLNQDIPPARDSKPVPPGKYSTSHTSATLDPLPWRILRFQKNVSWNLMKHLKG